MQMRRACTLVWAVGTVQVRQRPFESGLDGDFGAIAGTIGPKSAPKMAEGAKPQPCVLLPPTLLGDGRLDTTILRPRKPPSPIP